MHPTERWQGFFRSLNIPTSHSVSSNGGPQFHEVGGLTLENGQTIPDLALCYETWGTLNAGQSNAILLCHGGDGNRMVLGPFVGPGRAFDTDHYFIIASDAIGAGLSTSPKSTGLHMRFPRYNIRDMVRAQYDLITRGLDLRHLLTVAGPSMGSYQTLEWGINYPSFMAGLIPMVPTAKCGQQNSIRHAAERYAIMADQAWHGGDYTEPPINGLTTAAMSNYGWAYSEEWFHRRFATPEEIEDSFSPWIERQLAHDANNLIYQHWACDDHDVSKPSGNDMAQALGAIQARTLIISCTTDMHSPVREARMMHDLITRSEHLEFNSEWGHAILTAEYHAVSERIRRFLAELTP